MFRWSAHTDGWNQIREKISLFVETSNIFEWTRPTSNAVFCIYRFWLPPLSLILPSAFIIVWFLRFRHYWASRKHTKMSNNGTEICMPGGAHNNPYMFDGPNDGPIRTDMWSTGSNKAMGGFSGQYWPPNFAPITSVGGNSNPNYPMPSSTTTPWPEIAEAPIEPNLIKPVCNAMNVRAMNPTACFGIRGKIVGICFLIYAYWSCFYRQSNNFWFSLTVANSQWILRLFGPSIF